MEAALAEFKVEELGQDIEEDHDFTVEIDEQDAFESDFESTDEEGAQEDVDASAEKMILEEERKTRKVARSQLEKITAAAHARQKATFNPEHVAADAPKVKVKRKVSMGVVIDAETGTVVGGAGNKRHSQRRHTMLNTSLTDLRIKGEMEKKSTVPRRMRTKIRPPTQDELIARALDMEEGNIKEHRNYLVLEEEKRKRARLVRTAVEGPLLRWISKSEEVAIKVAPVPMPPPPSQAPSHYAYSYSTTTSLPTGYPPPPSYSPYNGTSHYRTSPAVAPSAPTQPHAPSPLPPAEPLERKETVTKNYVIHEIDQEEGTLKPLWKETMAAMFGDHVKWEELKVYTGRGRPLSRPQDTCLITGLPAIYKDPRTGVPYADTRAFEILTSILNHDFIWNEKLGCYVSSQEDVVQLQTIAESASSSTLQQI
ncbi:hypothetical protein PHLGIDRAFT_25831 [Phlebiopsis gigantea 11061_1 CR5-6]|uniref:Vps72/YL1 C-terminal domain-containing protein n=1 Tax=Phlebiopsis gigantea (strain 11061_1 CR5-6) TaxID=745531 RepID=A0A0C3S6A8_PHLG1|nr:hypothetical protein PHLGIDRAFT_25831 [Phlebiopsis gigantea 11061_1 CR5-6]